MPRTSDVMKGLRTPPGMASPSSYDSYAPQATVPGEQQFLQNLMAALSGATLPGAAMGVAGGIGQAAAPAMSDWNALGEAGAIFPKGGQAASAVPAQNFTPSEHEYELWRRYADYYARNQDWPNVLKSKWQMLSNSGGN